MTPWLQQYLAEAAARELAIRERYYGQVRAGQQPRGDLTDEEMQGDLAAWRVIAALFGEGRADSKLTFAELELWTSRALISREAAVDAFDSPARPEPVEGRDAKRAALVKRRDAVWAIHQRIAHRSQTITDLNTALRARAERAKAA